MHYTPGPWRIDNDGSIHSPSLGGGVPGKTVAVLLAHPEESANAKLIASAPEVIEAIKSALDSLEACEAGHAEHLLRAALAKATE